MFVTMPPRRRKASVKLSAITFNHCLRPEQRAAGRKVFETLLALYSSRRAMTAKDLCVLMHDLGVCNTPGGEFKRFGLGEGKQSGKYKRHVDSLLPSSGPFYRASIPAKIQHKPWIKDKSVVFRAVWETLSAEINENLECQEFLEFGGEDDYYSFGSLPVYQNHPMVQKSLEESGQYPVPLALYCDGVRFTPQSAGRSDQIGFAGRAALLFPQPLPSQSCESIKKHCLGWMGLAHHCKSCCLPKPMGRWTRCCRSR